MATYDDKELYELAEEVGQHLQSSGRKLTIAESCTGGWIAKAITDVPGSSQWFEYGFSVYVSRDLEFALGIRELYVPLGTHRADDATAACQHEGAR